MTKLNIIGGSYYESCQFPEFNEVFGSGLRAAIALSSLSKGINFYTISSLKKKKLLDIFSKQFDISIIDKEGPDISFKYLHPFSNPFIYTPSSSKSNLKIELTADTILNFGMLESEVIVNSEKCVYDPQSPDGSEYFENNGSSAKEVVYVLNSKEAINLTKNKDINKAGKELSKIKNVIGVVIKCDSMGTIVFHNNKIIHIPAFETKKVWLIGSGDIFSAVFYYFWCEKNLGIFESAKNASYYTAFYSETKILPLPQEISVDYNFTPKASKIKSLNLKGQVYLAGSFFNIQQRWFIDEIRNIFLTKKIKLFSPFHDIGLGNFNDVANKDLKALEKSKILFAIIDDGDVGTFLEIGYARALKIPVICYGENIKKQDLTMILGSNCYFFSDLSTAIYKTIWLLGRM